MSLGIDSRPQSDSPLIEQVQRCLVEGRFGYQNVPRCSLVLHGRYSSVLMFEAPTTLGRPQLVVKLTKYHKDLEVQYRNLCHLQEIGPPAFRTPVIMGLLKELNGFVMTAIEGKSLTKLLVSDPKTALEATYWVGRRLRQFHESADIPDAPKGFEQVPRELLCRKHDDFHPGNILVDDDLKVPGLLDPGPHIGDVALIYDDIAKFLVDLRTLRVALTHPIRTRFRFRTYADAFVEGYGLSFFHDKTAVQLWNSRLEYYLWRRKTEVAASIGDRFGHGPRVLKELVTSLGRGYLTAFLGMLRFPFQGTWR